MSKEKSLKRFVSVGTKLALATLLVLSGLSFLLYKELTQRERKHLIDSKSVAGTMVTELFATSCAAPLVFADNDAVMVELEKLHGNKAITYAAVFSSKEGKTVGEYNPRKVAPFDFDQGKVKNHLEKQPDKIQVLRGILDTRGQNVGFAVIHFSLEEENAAFQASRKRMLWFAFLLAGGTTGILILLARKVIVRPLSRVTEAAEKLRHGDLRARANVASADEVGNLAQAFNSMGDAILDREEKLIQAQKNVQDLFDNMLQAIFTIGADKKIGTEVSAYAKKIFGDVPIVGQDVMEFLQLTPRAHEEAVSRMRYTLELIFGADEFQWFLSEPDRIREITYQRTNPDGTKEDRALELDYAPLYKDGAIAKIMFLVKDVTDLKRLQEEIERRDQQNKENLARIRQIAAMEPDLFRTFITEAYAVLDACENSLADLVDPSRRADAVNSLFRGMHTLKGNARMVKLTAVQDIAHATEDYFQKVRDGQVRLNDDIAGAMQERIGEVRKLLAEFEKLGRQVLGGEQESPAEAALNYLRSTADPFEAWKPDLALLSDEGAEAARERLHALANQLRTTLLSHGFCMATRACDILLRELGKPGVTAEALSIYQQYLLDDLQITRALSSDIASTELWPYFAAEAKQNLRCFAGRISGNLKSRHEVLDKEAIDLFLFAATARSFDLPTLASIADEYRRRILVEGMEPRAALNVLEYWMADARNLSEMATRAETEISLLARFAVEAEGLCAKLDKATPAQVPVIAAEAHASARRHRFFVAQGAMDPENPSLPMEGPAVAQRLRQKLKDYQQIRDEIHDNETAEHLLLIMAGAANKGEKELQDWFAATKAAKLERLAAVAQALPALDRMQLVEDIRHFTILLPAFRGSKTGQPVQRILETRITALRNSLHSLRKAFTHVRTDSTALLPPLQEMEKAVVHLTSSSLGDVLAPVANSGIELARDRGKQLEEISLDNLEFFLDAKLMQKLRGAVVHAVRNAIDHGLESPDARISLGKPPSGRISITAAQLDNAIELSIQDDGRGIDTAKVKDVAISRGLVTPEAAQNLSHEQLYEFLFRSGFSTAASVTAISGRGVGMDAIREIARDLGGEVSLSSKLGYGTRLAMKIPIPSGSKKETEAAAPGKAGPAN